jgi:DNA-binding HxlR family transcriptional regulator
MVGDDGGRAGRRNAAVCELRRRLDGVSRKMLSQTLRRQERAGLVLRRLADERPLRVDYALTALGRDLALLAETLKRWAERHLKAIEAARRAFDARGRG